MNESQRRVENTIPVLPVCDVKRSIQVYTEQNPETTCRLRTSNASKRHLALSRSLAPSLPYAGDPLRSKR
jgi:hypothetical protein